MPRTQLVFFKDDDAQFKEEPEQSRIATEGGPSV